MHQLEEPTRLVGIVAEASRALERLADVRNDAVAPAPDLVAEQPKATGRARPDRTLGDDSALAALAPSRRLLDHKPPLRVPHLKRRVVEVAAIAVCQPRREPFEDAPVQTDGVATGAQGEPVQIDRGSSSRSHRVDPSLPAIQHR